MPPFQQSHLILPTHATALPYTSPNRGSTKVEPRQIGDRQGHGSTIRNQFNTAVEAFKEEIESDCVYIVFKSPLDFLLDIDKLDKGNFRLASYRPITLPEDEEGQIHFFYEATVCLNRRAVGQFLSKIEQYLDPTQDTEIGNPKNLSLIANIEEIRAATLQSFWQEPELAFPVLEEENWWEVWFSRDGSNDNISPLENIRLSCSFEINSGCRIYIAARAI